MTPESKIFWQEIARKSSKNAVVAVKSRRCEENRGEKVIFLGQNDGYFQKYSVASLCTAKTADFKSYVFLKKWQRCELAHHLLSSIIMMNNSIFFK